VRKDGIEVDGGSILDLMMLAASPGCTITVEAVGPEAEQVIEALEGLVADRFGEEG
jgi:phosphocarrier protein